MEGILELALLHRGELVVDHEHVGLRPRKRFLQLRELALADVRSRMRFRRALDQPVDRLDSGSARELAQLRELAFRIDAGSQHGEDESALGFGSRRGIRLAYCHAVDYAR